MSNLHVGDIGARIRLDFVDEFGASVDTRTASTREIFVRKPSDGRDTFSATVQGTQAVAIARVGTVATVTLLDHGFSTNQKVEIAGAAEGDYNGTFAITVVTVDTFTYTVAGSPSTPATGSPTAQPINRIFYDTIAADIDEAGEWDVQGRVVLPSGEDWSSDLGQINVVTKLV